MYRADKRGGRVQWSVNPIGQQRVAVVSRKRRRLRLFAERWRGGVRIVDHDRAAVTDKARAVPPEIHSGLRDQRQGCTEGITAGQGSVARAELPIVDRHVHDGRRQVLPVHQICEKSSLATAAEAA